MSSVKIYTQSNLLVPARSWIGQLPEIEQSQLLKMIETLEQTGDLRGPLVNGDGPGRYKVKVSDSSNRYKEYLLELSENEAKSDVVFLSRNELVFVKVDIDKWKVRSSPWVGMPGEEVFVNPAEVDEVLNAIKQGRKTADYRELPDGSFEIKIDRNGVLIFGSATWR